MTAATPKVRLTAVDATRGIALLGMMAVHSLIEESSPGHPSTSFAIFGGRAAATFAVLAGLGIAFMTGRRRVARVDFGPTAAMLAVRGLAIGVIGLALGYTDAELAVVILPYYAVLFLLAIPLVLLPSWAVAGVGVAVVAGVPPLTHFLQPRLPEPTLLNNGFAYAAEHPVRLLTELSLTGEYPALAWTAYLCAGIVIGRLTLSRVKVAVTLLVTGVTMAVGAAAVSWVLLNRFGGLAAIWAAQPGSVLTAPETTELLNLGGDGTTPTSTPWWLAVDGPHTGTAPDLVGTTGAAMALLGLLLLLGRLRVAKIVFAPLAAAGSMTLTFYTAHIMFLNSDYDVYTSGVGYALQVAGVLVVGLAWRATAGKGPLEALVTALATRAKRWVAPEPRLQVAT
ncbi:heparan-alpha-glucosaminide N-acetyltransferase domain-containing protein [Amycolatopsis sp. NPDC088138]|uniref:heparan-alpha-glucosaminide N-acetyltransferase domain-containing protein n=1 Tax=Amycolatopsis sp. NPDC088138 TaxID=3363938 RepID=UPI003806D663